MLTAAAVIGVGHFIAQRQDYENSIERSFQAEMEARVEIAEGAGGRAARRTIAREEAHRADLRSSISDDTRDTAILVGAGLIAGLIGALLLFAGLIASMRGRWSGWSTRPAGSPRATARPGSRSAAWRRRRRSAKRSTRWRPNWSWRHRSATGSTG